MRAFFLAGILLEFLALAGCSAQEMPPDAVSALRGADSFELYSLDPEQEGAVLDGTYAGTIFHRQAVLGSTMINDAATQTELIDALEQGVVERDESRVMCFYPRHGIRVEHSGHVYDFVICFECRGVAWYIDDALQTGFAIAPSPKPAFDDVLRNAGVPLPKAAHD